MIPEPPGRRRLGRVVAARIPPTLMEYPFETFCAVFGLVAGLVLLTSPEAMGSLWIRTVGTVPLRLLGAAFTLAAATLTVGLRYRYRLALYPGLRLLAALLGTFAAVDVWIEGWNELPNGVLIGFIGSLALLRSIFLRYAVEVAAQAKRRGDRG